MRWIFTLLLGISALFIAGCAAIFSVKGLGLLFAGSAVAVMIMAASLELGKLVAASFLYRFWHQISVAMKAYLLVAVGVLMCITSLGIYGYLARAYESTQTKVSLLQDQINTVQQQMHDTQAQIAAAKGQTTHITHGTSKQIADQQTRIDAADKLLKNSLARVQDRRDAARQTRDQDTAALQKQIDQADAQLTSASTDEQKAIDDLNARLAVLDRAVDEYTRQGGPGFLKNDGVKMGQQLREKQKPERDQINAAIEKHNANLADLRKTHDTTVAALNHKMDTVGKTYTDQLASLDKHARQLRADHDKTVAAADAQLASLRAGGDSKQAVQSDRITALYQRVRSQQDEIGAIRDRIAHTDIGTYTFVARAMGLPADEVVKWLILVIVLVFDPLAVTLTIGLNVALVRGEEHSWERARQGSRQTRDVTRTNRPRGLALAGMTAIGAGALSVSGYSLTHYLQHQSDNAYVQRIPGNSFVVLRVEPAALHGSAARQGIKLLGNIAPPRITDRLTALVTSELDSKAPVYFFTAYPHAQTTNAADNSRLAVIVGMVAHIDDQTRAESAFWRFTQQVAGPLLPAGSVSAGAVRSMVAFGDGRYLDPEGGFFSFGLTPHAAIMLMELDGNPDHSAVETEMRYLLTDHHADAGSFSQTTATLPPRATVGGNSISLWFDSKRCFAGMPKNAAAQTRYQRLRKWLAFQAALRIDTQPGRPMTITGDYRYDDKRFDGMGPPDPPGPQSGDDAVNALGPAGDAGTAGVLMDRCAQTVDFDSMIAQLRRSMNGDDTTAGSIVVDRTILSHRHARFVLHSAATTPGPGRTPDRNPIPKGKPTLH